MFGYPLGGTRARVVHVNSQMSWDDYDFACVIKIFEELIKYLNYIHMQENLLYI